MTDDKKHIPLRIERLPDGGFLVAEAWSGDGGRLCPILFASTRIGDALKYIEGRIDPDARA